MKRASVVFWAGLAGAMLAAVALSPIVLRPGQVLCAYDHPGDAMISIWSTWVRLGADAGRWSLDRVPLVAVPDGVNFRHNPPEPALEFPQLTLARVLGEVAAFNWHLWATFPLAAATAALLLWEMTRRCSTAIIGGLLYAFAPYHVAHTVQLSLASIQWMPLGLWAWYRLLQRPTWPRALVQAACTALIFWTTAYYGFLFLLASAAFLTGLLVSDPHLRRNLGLVLTRGIASYGLLAAVSLPWCGPFLHAAVLDKPGFWPMRYAFAVKHLFVYSAKPWDYLIPSIHHPWFGPLVKPFVLAHLYGSNVTEQTLYLGYASLGLCVTAIVMAAHRQASVARVPVMTLTALGLVSLWCSAPPLVPISPFRIEQDTLLTRWFIPFPSLVLHQLLPMFRVYARFGLLVGLATAGLAGIGWAALSDRLQERPALRRIVLVGIGLILAMEYAVALPARVIDPPPPVYEWLAARPGSGIIAEYPFLPSTHAFHAEYLFYQRLHGRPMLNGGFERRVGDTDRLAFVDLRDPAVARRLQARGVRYVVVHYDRYDAIPKRQTSIEIFGVSYQAPARHPDEELPAPPRDLPGLRQVAAFDDAIVYEPAS